MLAFLCWDPLRPEDCETQGLGRFRLGSLCFSHVLTVLYLAGFFTAHCSVQIMTRTFQQQRGDP